MAKSVGWLVLVREDRNDVWHDSGEGPFRSQASAERFADSEVGVDWVVVKVHGSPVNGRTGERVEF